MCGNKDRRWGGLEVVMETESPLHMQNWQISSFLVPGADLHLLINPLAALLGITSSILQTRKLRLLDIKIDQSHPASR